MSLPPRPPHTMNIGCPTCYVKLLKCDSLTKRRTTKGTSHFLKPIVFLGIQLNFYARKYLPSLFPFCESAQQRQEPRFSRPFSFCFAFTQKGHLVTGV